MFTQRLSLANQDVNKVSDIKLQALGTVAETADGRVFRYARAGGSDLAGAVNCIIPAAVANHGSRTPDVAAKGAKEVFVTLGATAAGKDDYADGFLAVVGGTGVGATYRIANNGAAAASGKVRVVLVDALATAFDGTTRVSLVKSPYDSVTTAATGTSVGVTTVALPSGKYGWIQERGACVVGTTYTVLGATVLS